MKINWERVTLGSIACGERESWIGHGTEGDLSQPHGELHAELVLRDKRDS